MTQRHKHHHMEHNQNKSLDELLELKVHRIEQTLNEFNVIKKHGDVDTIIAKSSILSLMMH